MNINKKIQLLEAANFSKKELKKKLEQGLLDELFESLSADSDWAYEMCSFFNDQIDRFQALAEHLEAEKEKILNVYIESFSKKSSVGANAALKRPDIIIVMGSGDYEDVQQQVKLTAELSKKCPNALILASGGGFYNGHTEAETVSQLLEQEAIADVLKEEDSLDLVGKAVFGKYTLKGASKLPEKANIVIVTRAKNAIRSKHIFEKTFGPSYAIAILYGQSAIDGDELIASAERELLSDSLSSYSIFRMVEPLSVGAEELDVDDGDDTTIFCNLMMQHDYYKMRPDLVRKYSQFLKKPKFANESQ